MLALVSLVLTAILQAAVPSLPGADVDVSGTAHRMLASEASGQATDTGTDDPVALPDGVTTEDWASVRAAYDAGRHAAFAVDGGYEAHNPGQALTAAFDGEGATVTPDSGDWTWGLALTSWGFEGALHEVSGSAELSADGARVTGEWGPGLSEWWINDTRGFEHGFTVHERPTAVEGSADRPLQFTVDVRGDLQPKVSSDRRSVEFVDAAGRAQLQYAGLVAFDADGASLDAWIQTTDDGLRVLVREGGARYPLTIDPVVQQEAYIKASNTDAGDQFGWSVSVSGDSMVVGAKGESSNATGVNGDQSNNASGGSGAVYVFTRSGGTWRQEAYLKASNPDSGDLFGRAVAISEDVLAVGAIGESSNATGVNGNEANNAAVASGAAYVFVRSGGVWVQDAYIKASNTSQWSHFGSSIAISGTTLVVGAHAEGSAATGINGNQAVGGRPDAGAAYVFTRAGGVWAQDAYVKASNTDAGDLFGTSVAIHGDTLVVTARLEASNASGVNGDQSDNSAIGAGAAYVFVRSGGSWSQQAYLKASNPDVQDQFGRGVAVYGDTLVVSAPLEDSGATGVNGGQDDNSVLAAGAAYVFTRGGGSWTQDAYLKASNTGGGDAFGYSIAVSAAAIAVGARREASSATGVNGNQADNSAPESGAAYVFVRSGALWEQVAYVKASNTDAGDQFAYTLDLSRCTLIVGAAPESSAATGVNGNQADNGAFWSGAVYTFDLDLPLGVVYCASSANSTGFSSLISAHGCPATADNSVSLMASSLPNHSFGVFLTSQMQGFVTNPGGSAGNLCLGGAIGRYVGPGQIQNSGTGGEISLVLDLTMTPTPTGFVSVQAGDTWNFQAWYRDAVGGAATSNFTNGLEILFR